MSIKTVTKFLICVMFFFITAPAAFSADKKPKTPLIDNFGKDANKPNPIRNWEFVTDKVMGGKSTGKMEMVNYQGRNCLHIKGDVSLEDKGGFIKVGTDLKIKRKYFNASDYDGVQLKLKGNGKKYAVHIRTKNTWLPWQRYEAKFDTNKKWQTVKIPFDKFKPLKLKKDLDKSRIKSIGIAAIGEEMKADIYIDEVTMYDKKAEYNKLTEEEKRVILQKGTERPFTGKFNDHFDRGVYTCRRCGAHLYRSTAKFKSSCGWPSFDDEIKGAVKRIPDPDGRRTEIVCANCGAHLGHVFHGEGYTPKNTRHCVNSISMDFIPAEELKADNPNSKYETAIFASGCFWGVEHQLKKSGGVISTTAGYTGGTVENPTYKQVCTGKTGHVEAVKVVFDPNKVSYEELAKLYFETHNFTQLNRQGPDIGTQYRTEIFYTNEKQKQTAEKLIKILEEKGYDVKTKLTEAKPFYPAEDYHQDYYEKTGKTPYCHQYKKIF